MKIHQDLLHFKRPSDHSKYSPSASDRWYLEDGKGCAFSVEFAEHIPNIDTVYSKEGTLAHSVCEAVIRQDHIGIPFPVELQMQMMSWDHQEMMDCAHGYKDVVNFWLNNPAIGNVIWWGLERGVPVFPEKGCFGTGDCIIIGTLGAVVIDYKHGKGKNVSATSTQLKIYAAGIARYLENPPEGYLVHAVVYQPRTDQFSKDHTYTMPELYECLGIIWKSIEVAESKDLVPIEGNWCYWCPAKRTTDPKLKCPAILGKPLQMAKENFAGFLNDMNAPIESLGGANPKRDEAIIKLIGLAPLIAQYAKDGKEELQMRIERGEKIPGIKLVEVYGNREIVGKNIDEKAQTIRSKFPQINPVKFVPSSTKMKTLSELEKELGKEGKELLDKVCMKKVTKEVEILDDKVQAILGEMYAYGTMITNNQGQEE